MADKIYEILKSVYDDKWSIRPDQLQRGLVYLKHYGYLDKPFGEMTANDILNGISKFQEVAGLLVDAELGPKTLTAMNWPRCGLKDHGFKLQVEPLKWAVSPIKYFIEARDTDLSVEVWDSVIAKSFGNWAKVAKLVFARVNSKSEAHVVCSAGSSRQDGFDGPNGTLAWAELPPTNTFSGQLLTKVDKSEKWINDPKLQGILLEAVLTHEFGHILGLDHSSKNSALMAPFYNVNIITPQTIDDIPRIQALYGVPTPSDPGPVPPPPAFPPVDGEELTIKIEGNITRIKIPGYRVVPIG